MRRRLFITLAAGAAVALPRIVAAVGSVPGDSAAARVGGRILATLSDHDLQRLRETGSTTTGTLPQRVAADHRAGRTLKVGGISLAVSEAAWCLAAAEGRALS